MLRRLTTATALIAGATVAHAALGPPVRIASTIAEPAGTGRGGVARTADGLLIYASLAGGSSPLPVAVTTSTDEGITWSAPTSPGSGNEPDVSAAPGGIVDVVWNDSGLRHSRSTDGGLTWSTPSHDPAWLVDPRVETATDGRIAVARRSGTPEIHVSTSTDGGATWSAVAALPYIASRKPSPAAIAWAGGDDLLVCFGEYEGTLPDPVGRAICHRSTDGGISFGPRQIVYETPPDASGVPTTDLAVRAAGDVVLAVGGDGWPAPADVVILRSTDGGATWGTPALFPRTVDGDVAISAGSDGSVWWIGLAPGDLLLHHSVDGVTWSALPEPVQCTGVVTDLIAIDVDRAILMSDEEGGLSPWPDRKDYQRTIDRGQTWDDPRRVVASGPPVSDTELTRTPNGRLVSAWTEGSGSYFASHSDDGGTTWSTPVTIEDATLAFPVDHSWVFSTGSTALVATPTGVVALWTRQAGACVELRASRSDDGASWEPSVPIAVTGLPMLHDRGGLAVDGAGRVVAAWTEDDRLIVASSFDDGRSWTSPQTIAMNVGDTVTMRATQLVRAADGALVIAAGTDVNYGRSSQATILRTEDGGVSWVETDQLALTHDLHHHFEAVAAGPRIVVYAWGNLGFSAPSTSMESRDGGLTWADSTYRDQALVGDASGSIYAWDGLQLWARRLDQTSDDLGRLPPVSPDKTAGMAAVALDCGPDAFGVAWADWDRPDPGIFYAEHAAAGAILLRDSVASLDPPPDLGPLFPLPPYLSTDVCGGMLDPDPDVLATDRPLILYQIEGPPGPLTLVREATRIRLFW